MSAVSEIQIVPIKPANGLVAFASFVLDERLYLGSIGVLTRPLGGYRLVYPTRKIGNREIDVFHPINKDFGLEIEKAVISKFEEVVKKQNAGHGSFNS